MKTSHFLLRVVLRLEALFRALGGIPPVDKKLAQFLLNDRKVLRFKAGFWALRLDTTSPDNCLTAPQWFVLVAYMACLHK